MRNRAFEFKSAIEADAIGWDWEAKIEEVLTEGAEVDDIVTYCVANLLNLHITVFDNSSPPYNKVLIKEINSGADR